MNGHFINRLMWGLFIIVVGIGLMLRQGGMIDFDIGSLVSTFWPAILLFIGLQELLKKMAVGGSLWGAGVLLIVGFIFLGRNMGWLIWSMGDMMQFIVPAIIILIGLRMIMKPKTRREEKTPTDDWKAYRYPPSDTLVPPAPPLHPDPTSPIDLDAVDHELKPESRPVEPAGPQGIRLDKRDDYRSERGDAGAEQAYRQARQQAEQQAQHQAQQQSQQRERDARHAQQGHFFEQQYFDAKMDRWSKRAERVRERMEQRMHRHHGRHHGRHDRMEWWNHDPNTQTRSGFIGDIYVGHDYWELKPMNISHFIGDTVLDLTKAQIPLGETRINISSFIGDVKVYLPDDFEIGVNVVSSAFIGDVSVLDRKEGGMFKNMNVETAYFQETEKKIKLVVSTFIGDVRVTKVG